jgi:hypothetical protein
MGMDFVKSLQEATSVPGNSPAPIGFDPFAPTAEDGTPFAKPAEGPDTIPGATAYDVSYHCGRFFVGRQLEYVDEKGVKNYNDIDDSEALCEVMDKVTAGKAWITLRQQTFTDMGSVVIWMEWNERKPKPAEVALPGEERLTVAQMKSPARLTPESKENDAAADAEEKGDAPPTPGPNDEPDWE